MSKLLAILAGAGAGALAMYLFDPNGGNRRRAMIRDKAVGLSNDAKRAFNRTAKDLSNRAQGVMHDVRSLAAGQTSASQNISSSSPSVPAERPV